MPNLTKLVEAQAELAAKLTAELIRQMWVYWSRFGPAEWWNDDLVNGNAAKSASLMESALNQTRLNQRSFTKSVFTEMSIGMEELPPAQVGYPRANVTPFKAYQRPATEYRWLESQGLVFDEAHMRANTRMEKLADADLLRARMDEAQSLNDANPKVIGTRRIIHPERSETGTCGLCLVASNQFYQTDAIIPIHDECKCTTLGITRESDPGVRLNRQDLDEIYAAAGSTSAGDLLNTRVRVAEHGELGPVLVRQGQHFKTAEEAGRPPFVKPTRETIRASRSKERDQISTALETAEANYAEILKTEEPGQGKALAQFRAMKNMRDRVASIDMFLRSQ